jgi:hypothetical protein
VIALGKGWSLGWSRNVAIGVIWNGTGWVGILFLGLSLVRSGGRLKGDT